MAITFKNSTTKSSRKIVVNFTDLFMLDWSIKGKTEVNLTIEL